MEDHIIYKVTLESNNRLYSYYFCNNYYARLFQVDLRRLDSNLPLMEIKVTEEVLEFVAYFQNKGCPEEILFNQFPPKGN